MYSHLAINWIQKVQEKQWTHCNISSFYGYINYLRLKPKHFFSYNEPSPALALLPAPVFHFPVFLLAARIQSTQNMIPRALWGAVSSHHIPTLSLLFHLLFPLFVKCYSGKEHMFRRKRAHNKNLRSDGIPWVTRDARGHSSNWIVDLCAMRKMNISEISLIWYEMNTGSGAEPTSYPMGTADSGYGVTLAGAWSSSHRLHIFMTRYKTSWSSGY